MKIRFLRKNTSSTVCFSFLACMFLISCTSQAPHQKTAIKPERPEAPGNILGRGLVGSETLGAFLLKCNDSINIKEARMLADIYIKESAAEGINHDVAFSQMCLETGFLRFGGLVTPDMNNYCGLGSIGPGQKGHSFPSQEIGVRAHIQHLKGYATTDQLKQSLVDPRYRYIKYGSAPNIYELAGRWAADREYGNKIAAILDRLYAFAF